MSPITRDLCWNFIVTLIPHYPYTTLRARVCVLVRNKRPPTLAETRIRALTSLSFSPAHAIDSHFPSRALHWFLGGVRTQHVPVNSGEAARLTARVPANGLAVNPWLARRYAYFATTCPHINLLHALVPAMPE